MSIEYEITAIENNRADLILNHNLPGFFDLFSPEFIATNPFNNVVNKEQVFELFTKGITGNVSSFEVDIEKIALINGLTIVMGKETLVPKGESKNSGKTIKRCFTNIWIKNTDSWKITARHASNISIA